jgi:hypothetical protein
MNIPNFASLHHFILASWAAGVSGAGVLTTFVAELGVSFEVVSSAETTFVTRLENRPNTSRTEERDRRMGE